MSNDIHPFRVGEFACAIVSDGTFDYPHPGPILFSNAPDDELASALLDWNVKLSEWGSYESPYPGLLIDTGEQKLLVDVGAGNIGPKTGQLIKNLSRIGVEPGEIDVVVLTHAHPDHIGGLLDSDGRLSFSNARHVMSKHEWDFWDNAPDLSPLALPDPFKAGLLACAAKNLPPLKEHVQLIEPDEVIVTGVRAIDARGHTPGQIGLEVTSGEHKLFAVADAIVHPVHVRFPQWTTAIDYSPSECVETRRRILRQAVAEECLVFAYHFPAPGLGHVRTDADRLVWTPI